MSIKVFENVYGFFINRVLIVVFYKYRAGEVRNTDAVERSADAPTVAL